MVEEFGVYSVEGDENKVIGIKRTRNKKKRNFPPIPLMKSEKCEEFNIGKKVYSRSASSELYIHKKISLTSRCDR